MSRSLRAVLGVVALLAAATALPASALPADPDPTFAPAGVRCAPLVAIPQWSDAGATVTASDGTTYVAGVHRSTPGPTPDFAPDTGDALYAAAVKPGGSLGWIFEWDRVSAGRSIALHPASNPTRVLVGGATDSATVILALKLADGTVDTTFGTDGVASVGIGNQIHDLAVSSTGSIYGVAGTQLFRRTASGASDPTFAGTGQASVPFPPVEVAVSTDGAYVAGHGVSDADPGWRLRRYTTAGLADPTFNGGSTVVTAFPEPVGFTFTRAYVHSLVLQGGKPLLGGNAVFDNGNLTFPSDLALARYTTAGALDTTFDNDGRQTAHVSTHETIGSLVIDSTPRIIASVLDRTAQTARLARWSDSGALDSVFGTPGFDIFATSVPGIGLAPNGSYIATTGTAPTGVGRVEVRLLQPSNVEVGAATFGAAGNAGPVDIGSGLPSCPFFGAGVVGSGAESVADAAVLPGTLRGYTMNGNGRLRGFAFGDRTTPPGSPAGAPFWGSWSIARALALRDHRGGYLLDGFGGLHRISVPGESGPAGAVSPYFGFDIARDVVFMPDGRGGYILDGWGGMHPFAVGANPKPPKVSGGPYWAGWDIAKKAVINAAGTGGYIMDAFGGMHRFRIGSSALPPATSGGPYWVGWKIARDVVLVGGGGYLLDGFGGVHRFKVGDGPLPAQAQITSYSSTDSFRAFGIYDIRPPEL